MTLRQWPRIAHTAAALWVFLIPLATELQAADGPDLARERRLVEQIEDAIIDGETLRLVANDQAFFAIYTETEADPPKGAVLLLHGRGLHPDWAGVMH